MSSKSYADDCPNCGKLMKCSKGSNPFDTMGACMFCGYFYVVIVEQMTIPEINQLRKEFNEILVGGDMQALYRKQRMLTKLPRMKKSVLTP